MKTKHLLSLLAIVNLLLISCGKSNAELELEKAKIELEKTKLELENKKDEAIKDEKKAEISEAAAARNLEHQKKSNVGKQIRLAELNDQLQKLPLAIKEAEQKVRKVNEFQLGRSSTVKQEQLDEAILQLNEIKSYDTKIKNEIAQLEYSKTFDFQKNPVDLLNYIFESTKNRDFKNFRYLSDPYTEIDNSVKLICYAEILSTRQQENFITDFENGRIIGKPKIKNNTAEIEFAFGPYSDKLEVMNLVNRNGLWFLKSY